MRRGGGLHPYLMEPLRRYVHKINVYFITHFIILLS
uniref:Uncharacterized protein n=1 Tax=Anguilla anguilla TaxID=7936 RepID=A0A0E9U7L2_ANGAN